MDDGAEIRRRAARLSMRRCCILRSQPERHVSHAQSTTQVLPGELARRMP